MAFNAIPGFSLRSDRKLVFSCGAGRVRVENRELLLVTTVARTANGSSLLRAAPAEWPLIVNAEGSGGSPAKAAP